MSFYGNNVGIIPLTDAAGITKLFSWPSHKGLDIGWYAMQYCPVLAWQDGFVVDKGYGSEVGNYIIVEHTYNTGKRWTGYIHLKDTPSVKKGDKVYFGKQMGNAIRGNSGVSNGVHLHLYLTKIVPIKTLYTWDTMLANCIDPKPYLYWSKEYNTAFISSVWTKELKMIEYPQPVTRNEKVHQVDIKSDTRRLRILPSITATSYDEYCIKGIYNVYDEVVADGYTWVLIAEIGSNKFWVAMMSGEDLPAKVVVYPEPVERNTQVQQVDIKSDTRKLRAQPSLEGDQYDELCKRGIYNVLKWETADGYDWALIAVINEDEFWVAVMEGEDLPIIKEYEKLYEEEKKKNEILALENSKLITKCDKLLREKELIEDELSSLEEVNAGLVRNSTKLNTEIKVLKDKLIEINKLSVVS